MNLRSKLDMMSLACLGHLSSFAGRGDIQEGAGYEALEFGRETWAEEGQRGLSESAEPCSSVASAGYGSRPLRHPSAD